MPSIKATIRLFQTSKNILTSKHSKRKLRGIIMSVYETISLTNESLCVILTVGCLILDYMIMKYVKLEYEESKDLNIRINKMYKSKKKKATLVKAIINAPTESENK